jgi:hypothetical protein
VERNRKAGQNPTRVVAPIEEEERKKDTLFTTNANGLAWH